MKRLLGMMLLACGFLMGCESAAPKAPSPAGTPLGDSGVRVGGSVQAGGRVVAP